MTMVFLQWGWWWCWVTILPILAAALLSALLVLLSPRIVGYTTLSVLGITYTMIKTSDPVACKGNLFIQTTGVIAVIMFVVFTHEVIVAMFGLARFLLILSTELERIMFVLERKSILLTLRTVFAI